MAGKNDHDSSHHEDKKTKTEEEEDNRQSAGGECVGSGTGGTTKVPALVFGATGEQGRAVLEGLMDSGLYEPVYGFTRRPQDCNRTGTGTGSTAAAAAASAMSDLMYLTDALGVTVLHGDLQNPVDVRRTLSETAARAIFLVTTTELPTEVGQTSGFSDAAQAEFQVIAEFFQILVDVHRSDGVPRHVVFSTRDDVQEHTRLVLEETGELWIDPLDDGSIVPHYSSKGRGGAYAAELLSRQERRGLRLTRITMPFLFSNFLGFFAPLPNEAKTQWTLSACLGDGDSPIDMMSAQDLAVIVPNIFARPEEYDGQNLRLVGEQIGMDQVAEAFSDLFGKDVIYNPLTPEEVSILPFASAPAMAQMCQFVGDPRALRHDPESTRRAASPKKLHSFADWLLTHSDSTAFSRVGLDLDAPEISTVAVFGATSPQGTSVVRGLLNDSRKKYTVIATSRHVESDRARALQALDPDRDRVKVVYADFDDVESCRRAVAGAEGAFLVTEFYEEEADQDTEREELHARNIIDACEAAASVRHLVFSTMESAEEVNRLVRQGIHEPHAPAPAPRSLAAADKGTGGGCQKQDSSNGKDGNGGGAAAVVLPLDAKARAAAYARTKKLSCTFVLMPCYSEMFLEMMELSTDAETGRKKLVLSVPLKKHEAEQKRVMCMSVDDLGPAVANIFDSYQVYAGREIGLVTDFVTVSEVRDILQDVLLEQEKEERKGEAEATAAAAGGNREQQQQQQQQQQTMTPHWQPANTYMKDLGQMFAYMSHTDAVKSRHSVAQTMKLVPSARPLKLWVEHNVDNVEFREKLGLR